MSDKYQNKKNQRATLGAVAALLMLAALDQTIVTTALPAIVSDLGSLNQLSWVVTAYLLTSTISAPIYGSLGDTFGRKVMMKIAIIIFVIASIFVALAQTMWWIILARAIQGLGGGGLFVLAFTVIGDIVPSRERGKIQGLFAAVFGLSSILGPLIGGFFVDKLSWHWIFFINVPIGFLALAILQTSFNEIKYRSMIQLDYYGASLLCISLTSLILLITKFEHEASSIFLSKPALLITFCLSAILFVLIEKKAPNPVLPLTLLQINNFRFYSLIGFLTGSILFSILTFIPFYLQVCRGVTPTNSGLQIIPLTIGIIFGTTISGIIMTKLGNYKLLPFSGSIILFLGLIFLSSITMQSSTVELSLLLFVIGVGVGPQLSVTTTAIQNAVPKGQMGVATAGLTLARQVGSSIGLAGLTTIFIYKIENSSIKNKEKLFSMDGQTGLNMSKVLTLPEDKKFLFQNLFADGLQTVFFSIALLSLGIIVLSLFIKEIPLKTEVSR